MHAHGPSKLKFLLSKCHRCTFVDPVNNGIDTLSLDLSIKTYTDAILYTKLELIC